MMTKLELRGGRVRVPAAEAYEIAVDIFERTGVPKKHCHTISEHLVDANLCGVESHGVMRVMQYVERLRDGTNVLGAMPELTKTPNGVTVMDGHMGVGIPAMKEAYETVTDLTGDNGMGAMAVVNCGHTGRHGAFADAAAERDDIGGGVII
ncbi:MAG: Ldh family oxidoreductase, partial [Rhodobacteraceae bacterium]|nr:Ldh family oxidoreductase [Paracoccaceae bacterium]